MVPGHAAGSLCAVLFPAPGQLSCGRGCCPARHCSPCAWDASVQPIRGPFFSPGWHSCSIMGGPIQLLVAAQECHLGLRADGVLLLVTSACMRLLQMWSTAVLQAEQVKAVALRIAQKYYGEPQRINARWQRRHGALEAPSQLEGVPVGRSQLKAEDLKLHMGLPRKFGRSEVGR